MEQKSFRKIEDSREWQELLEKVLFKTFFHNTEWEEFLEKQFKWLKFKRYIYKDSALLSMASVGNKLISHPFCEYGGPLPLAGNIDYGQFRRDLLSEFQNPVKISFHPFSTRTFLAPFETRSVLAPSERVTYFIEGAPDLRKTTSHEIEKARANALRIEKCDNEKSLRNFYGLHVKNAKKHKIPAYPFSFFEYFFDSKESEIILAKDNNGFVIAGSVFLFYDRFVHYFQNASDERYKNLGANYLILSDEIEKCLKNNMVFDFGGTRTGSSLQTFKEGWGGRQYQIFELKNYSEKSSLRQSNLRNLFGLMPDFLIQKLSPYLLKYKL